MSTFRSGWQILFNTKKIIAQIIFFVNRKNTYGGKIYE
jgi:hypothetical protein